MRIAPLALLLVSGTASAHIAMTKPAVRSVDQKAGPCGQAGSSRGGNVTEFQPGEEVTIEWDETVDHPGHYRISFDDDGNDFMNPNNPDDGFATTMVEPIADKQGGHYTQTFTLPTTPCDNCTIQLVQVMTTSIPYNSFYFQCADIRIAGDVVPPDDEPEGGVDSGCNAGGGVGLGGMVMLLGLRRRRRAR